MEGLRTESTFAMLSNAQVIGYDAEHNSVYIQLPSGQTPMFPARVLYLGCADGIRIHQLPLPIIGTWGMVVFPSGDDRYPIWLGSYYPNNNIDAITTDANLQSSQVDYYSHASGYYSLLDYIGQQYMRFPDGTSINLSTQNTQPQTFRHNVTGTTGADGNTTNQPQRIQMTDAFRVPNPPSPFFVALQHPSGASATISPSGLVTLVAGGPTNPSITMTPSGIVTINTTPHGGQTQGPTILLDAVNGDVFINGQQGNSQIHMDTSGNITINSSANVAINGASTIDLSSGSPGNAEPPSPGGLALNSASDINLITSLFQTTLNAFFLLFNNHVHSGVQSGQSDTGPPTLPVP